MKKLKEILIDIFREQKKKKKIEIGLDGDSAIEKANLQRNWDRLWRGRQ